MIPELLELVACPPLGVIGLCCSSLGLLPCEGIAALSDFLSILVLIGIGLELLGIGILIPLNACLSFGMLASNCLSLSLSLGNGWCSLVFKELLHLLVVNLPKLGSTAKGFCTKAPLPN
jgi:hypothetical protein